MTSIVGMPQGNGKREHILCAAIWVNDKMTHIHQPTATGLVFCGHRHHNIISQIWGVYAGDWARHRSVQGFLTSTGRFVNRRDALEIAKLEDQLAGQALREGQTELFSENLY